MLWVACGVSAFLLLPVGAVRLLAYRSGEVDHTPALRAVAVFALVGGGVAFAGFLVLALVLAVRGDAPW